MDYVEIRTIFLNEPVCFEVGDTLGGDVSGKGARELVDWWDCTEILDLPKF
jgi:hypothetical protein